MKKIISKIFLILVGMTFVTGAGYKGSLPNITQYFESERTGPSNTRPIFNTDGKPNDPKFKRVPRENPQYIDIILKK